LQWRIRSVFKGGKGLKSMRKHLSDQCSKHARRKKWRSWSFLSGRGGFQSCGLLLHELPLSRVGVNWRMFVALHLDDPSIASEYFAHDGTVL